MALKSILMNEADMGRALKRIAHEILEHNHGAENVILLGIRRRGVPLAKILAENIKAIEGADVPVGELDITFYRDDLSHVNPDFKEPIINSTKREDVPFEIVDKDVILVDDVIYTGRTARAALDACSSYGRAKTIQLAALVDRGHRELPIKADYIGKNVPTSKNEKIAVMVKEIDGEVGVQLHSKE